MGEVETGMGSMSLGLRFLFIISVLSCHKASFRRDPFHLLVTRFTLRLLFALYTRWKHLG